MASREVSAMIKHGFIPDSSKSLLSLSPPPTLPKSPQSPSPCPRPTLFEMMSEEQLREIKHSNDSNRRRLQDKLANVLSRNPNLLDTTTNHFGDLGFRFGDGDVKLTVTARDGFKVSLDVHRRVLVQKSGFFAEKLTSDGAVVEICDCDDVEVYVEALVLMYCDDLRKKLMGEDVSKVLGLLKVSAALMFEGGIVSCLEYLEAVPWSEDEEEKVVCCLTQLDLESSKSDEVLRRVASEPSASESVVADDIYQRMLTNVLQAKDDKARREMKSLISRLLREDASDNNSNYGERIDVSKDTLYNLCHRCLSALILCLSEATCIDEGRQDRVAIMGEIAREADNLQWIVDILIDKRMADEFVKLWAEQKELATLHSKIPTMYRHEISRITAQLCIGIGRGHLLVPKETRYSLLSTWMDPLYEDFGWMRRACRSLDKKLVEDGLSQTILTLPLKQQQSILLNWFDRFLNKGDDCPNIQRAFEIWWRRAFIRQFVSDQDQSELQITVCDYPR